MVHAFGVGDAIKPWFGLFNLFLEANQIVIAENIHSPDFSDITISRDQLQLIISSQSSILSSDKEFNNLPFESASLAGARRVVPLEVIQSLISSKKQERRH